MSNNKGYVYVMINHSYEGLVKIGKTTKNPDDRAKELSSATGVALPFIVVYKKLFNDCHIAETLVHKILEDRGLRVNKSREFFSVDISEAIDIIMQVSEHINHNESCSDMKTIDDGGKDEDLAELYYEQGQNYYYGLNDTFEDIEQALEFYENSANLGCAKAYLKIGKIYAKEKRNIAKAINIFQQGVKVGNGFCYAELGMIYMSDDSGRFTNLNNANLAWRKYFEFIDTLQTDLADMVSVYAGLYLTKCIVHKITIHASIEPYILKYNDIIYKEIQSVKKQYGYAFCDEVLEYLNELCVINGITNNIETYKNLAEESYKLAERICEVSKNLQEYDRVQKEEEALSLYQRSANLGCIKAYSRIGCMWLLKGDLQKTNTAWKNFYNKVYEYITNKSTISSNNTTTEILSGYLEMFALALNYDYRSLLHPYYAYSAMHLDIVSFYTKQIEELNKEMKIAGMSVAQKESYENLKRIHAYIKEMTSSVLNTDGTQVKFFRLE